LCSVTEPAGRLRLQFVNNFGSCSTSGSSYDHFADIGILGKILQFSWFHQFSMFFEAVQVPVNNRTKGFFRYR
jgi:hypothetical protein